MPVTPIIGLPYPALNDSPNGPAQMQALAEATETAITGRTTLTSGLTAQGTWSVSEFGAIKLSSVVFIHAALTSPNPPTVESNGNVTGDPNIAILPAGYRPPFVFNTLIGNGIGNGEALINTSGVVSLRSWTAGQQITANANTRFTACFIAP